MSADTTAPPRPRGGVVLDLELRRRGGWRSVPRRAGGDRARDDLLRSLGCTVLRFGYERIVNDIDGVVAEIEAALCRDGVIHP